MLELWRNIGPGTDIPAGDIGVGGREVNFMYGMYKKLARENSGTFTGKGLESGGVADPSGSDGLWECVFFTGDAENPECRFEGEDGGGFRFR